jgi:hypothetical protein
MSRRIDIELTSTREDGSWTWRAAGAREPRGTLEGDILPSGAEVGSVLRAEVEGFLDGLSVVAVLPPRAPRSEPERLELKSSRADQPLVTSTLAPQRSGERGRRNDRGRDGRDGREGDRREGDRREGRDAGEGRRERRGPRDRDRDRDRSAARHERPARPAPPPVEAKPKPKRLRPGKAHRTALLEAVPVEQRPIAEQLLVGGIPSVRQAIEKQNAELKAEGKPEVKPDALLRVAEELRPRALAAVWRDRAEAAAAVIDDLDLRDLRSVVNAAGDAGRDEEARSLAAQLREALTVRVEKEQADWLAELAETVKAGRVVRALRLSSRPPKAGAPIPGDIATQLAEATAASLTDETGPERWATVLDALAYSPVRRRVIPQSLPAKLSTDLRATVARLASRLPDIAHIFDIEPDPAAERAARGQARRRPGDRKDGGRKEGGRKAGDGKAGEGARKGDRRRKAKSDDKPVAKAGERPRSGDKAAARSEEVSAVETREPRSGDKAAARSEEVSAVETQEPRSGDKAAARSEEVSAVETREPRSGAEPAAASEDKVAGDESTTAVDGPAAEENPAVGEAPKAEDTATVDGEAAAEETSSVSEAPSAEPTEAHAPEASAPDPGQASADEPTAGVDAETGDGPTPTNGSAAAGSEAEEAGTGEASAGEPAAGEPAAEAQPQS